MVFRPAEQTDWVFSHFEATTEYTSRLVSRQKKRPGMRAITNSGQLQNNCPLFVWQNHGNFMQSVITLLSTIHTMRLVVHNSFQIHWFVNYFFGSSTIVQKNRMIQIAQCEQAFSNWDLNSQILIATKITPQAFQFSKSNRSGLLMV